MQLKINQMNLKELKIKLKSVELGESNGLLNSIFLNVSDNMHETYAALKLDSLSTKPNIGDLVFIRLYSKGLAQMNTTIGVVTKAGRKQFEYLTYKNGKNIKVLSDYNLIKKNGNCLLGFHTIIKD